MKHSNVNKNERFLERADFTSNLCKTTFLKRFCLRELNIFVKINLILSVAVTTQRHMGKPIA